MILNHQGEEYVAVQTGSHVPLLAEMASSPMCDSVIEFGCGCWSTPMLRGLCRNGREFTSYETDKRWAKRFPDTKRVKHYPGPWRENQRVGLVFIDCDPPEERMRLALAWRDHADFIICHDANRDAYGWDFEWFRYVKIYETGDFHTAVVSMFQEV